MSMSRFACVALLAVSLLPAPRVAAESHPDEKPGRVSGGIELVPRSANEITFDRNRGALFAYYGIALRTNDKLEGNVVFEISLSVDGAVTDCRIVSSELHAPELEDKFIARIRLIRFGPQSAPVTFRRTMGFFSPV